MFRIRKIRSIFMNIHNDLNSKGMLFQFLDLKTKTNYFEISAYYFQSLLTETQDTLISRYTGILEEFEQISY